MPSPPRGSRGEEPSPVSPGRGQDAGQGSLPGPWRRRPGAPGESGSRGGRRPSAPRGRGQSGAAGRRPALGRRVGFRGETAPAGSGLLAAGGLRGTSAALIRSVPFRPTAPPPLSPRRGASSARPSLGPRRGRCLGSDQAGSASRLRGQSAPAPRTPRSRGAGTGLPGSAWPAEARSPRKRLAAPARSRGLPPPRARGGSDPRGREQPGHSGRDTLPRSREPGLAADGGLRAAPGPALGNQMRGARYRIYRTASSRPSARGEPAEVAVQTSGCPAPLPSTSGSRESPPLICITTAPGIPGGAGLTRSAGPGGADTGPRRERGCCRGAPRAQGEKFQVAGMGSSRGVSVFPSFNLGV